ncbi:hypothetical protein D6851_00300 [Altericroceibacterium spongiae]|uniref:Uncharacterized protein n=2 Tax=Altericroceibacterium spongiae TaxID=2320269 RepID=A0A420EQN3_9SPHN|nr:hypothetical protein D6851_00300 [Altericroceibacterium spongiae]
MARLGGRSSNQAHTRSSSAKRGSAEKLAHSEGVFTNQILEELAGWEKILQHTSLSQTFDPDELEGEDEDALRDRRLATVRRRRRRS